MSLLLDALKQSTSEQQEGFSDDREDSVPQSRVDSSESAEADEDSVLRPLDPGFEPLSAEANLIPLISEFEHSDASSEISERQIDVTLNLSEEHTEQARVSNRALEEAATAGRVFPPVQFDNERTQLHSVKQNETAIDGTDEHHSADSNLSGASEAGQSAEQIEADQRPTQTDSAPEYADVKEPEVQSDSAEPTATLDVLIFQSKKSLKARRRRILLLVFLGICVQLIGGLFYYEYKFDQTEEYSRLQPFIPREPPIEVEPVPRSSTEHGPSLSRAKAKTNSPLPEVGLLSRVKESASQTQPPHPAEATATIEDKDDSATSREALSSSADTPLASDQIRIRRHKLTPEFGLQINQAYAAYREHRYDRAQSLYQSVLAQYPKQRDALLGLAAIARVQGRRSVAVDYYRKLLQLDRRDAYATAALATLQEQGSAMEKSVRLQARLRENAEQPQVLSHDNTNPDFAFNLAVALDHLGKGEHAVNYYRKALSLAQERASAFHALQASRRIDKLNRGSGS